MNGARVKEATKMKIIYLHQYFNTPQMVGGTRSYEMARRMVHAGHDVHMVTSLRETVSSLDRQKTWFETEEAGISVHWLPVRYANSMSYPRRIYAFFQFAIAARKKVTALSGDIIFATSTPLTISIPAVFASRRCKIPLLFEVRDLWPELPIAMGALKNPILKILAKYLENWSYKNSAAIVALSSTMKTGIIKTGYPKKRVAVIPNISNTLTFKYNTHLENKFRAERKWLKDFPLLTYAGTFGKINNVDYLLKLAKELLKQNSNVKILLVGDGSERETLISKASATGVLGVNLFIEKPLKKNEIPALLSASTAAAVLFKDIPEMQANSANKFFDALASGTPVILNFGGWMHELVVERKCGLALWRMPIPDVAIEIHTCLNNFNWKDSVSKEALTLAKTYFEPDLLANKLLRVIDATVMDETDNCEAIAPDFFK